MLDAYENVITTQSHETIDAINRFSKSLIGYGTDFGIAFEASDNDPDCALVAALGGLLGLFMETTDRLQVADHYLERAIAAAPRATVREQLFVKAIVAWRHNDIKTALSCHRQLAENYPRDLLSVKIGQTHYFNLGDDEGMLWLADKVIDAHRNTAFAHGMRAFGLEQMSRLDEAESEARQATEMQRCEPWAHHAVAHVMITQGRTDEGIAWLRDLSSEWEGCNSFMYTHNWWHLAVFHIENEEFDEAVALYDKFVWGRDKTYSQDQINAVSLLWRLELAGVNVGDRWTDLSQCISRRTFMNDQPFLDMQYAFALAKGGEKDALEQLFEGMERNAQEGPQLTRNTWRNVAVSAAKAFVSFAEGDYKSTLSLLAPARDQMQNVGGSHAQRDLFEQVWISSLLEVKDVASALPLIEQRVAFRTPVKQDISLLSTAKTMAAHLQ